LSKLDLPEPLAPMIAIRLPYGIWPVKSVKQVLWENERLMLSNWIGLCMI